MNKLNIRKDDTVLVIAGNDKGKKGKVLRIISKDNKAIVEGVNIVKKHKKARKQGDQSGIISIEAPINISNLKLICPKCNEASRMSHTKYEGKGVRVCKKCGEMLVR